MANLADYKAPAAIVVVGASRNQSKYGNRAVRAYKDAGTKVLPVNPSTGEIEGISAYKSVKDLPPGETTVATIYTQPAVTMGLLQDLADYGIKETFFNPGSETDELVAKARELGIGPLLACSITAINKDPADYAPKE